MQLLVQRLIRSSVAVLTAAALLLVFAASSASASETKTFSGQKECGPPASLISPPAPGGYCVITLSSLKVLRDATVYYTDATLVAGVLRSPVTLVTDDGDSTATGQCTYHRPTLTTPGHGLCTYWAGTGKLAGFHADVVVGPPIRPGVFSLTGTYWFDRDGDEDES
jgi:hypothetical protein